MKLKVRVRSAGTEKYEALAPVKPANVTITSFAASVPVFLMINDNHAPRGPDALHVLASTHSVSWELRVIVRDGSAEL